MLVGANKVFHIAAFEKWDYYYYPEWGVLKLVSNANRGLSGPQIFKIELVEF